MSNLISQAVQLTYYAYDSDPETLGFIYRDNDTIFVTYKGVCTYNCIMRCLNIMPSKYDNNSYVHSGLLETYNSINELLDNTLGDITSNDTVIFCGHSFGGSIATLCAYNLIQQENINKDNVYCITFGSPSIGSCKFVRNFEHKVPNNYRITLEGDLIPRIPFYNHTHNHISLKYEPNENNIIKHLDSHKLDEKKIIKLKRNLFKNEYYESLKLNGFLHNVFKHHFIDSYVSNIHKLII